MKIQHRRIFLLFSIIFGLGLVACSAPPPAATEAVEPAPEDGVLVHISRGPDEPQRVLMGLRMANVMAEDKKVLVYFDIKGVQAVLKDSPEITKEGFPSAKEQIKSLIDKGITIFVCPSCLNAAGKTEQDVMDGVKIAEKETFFSFADGRILTIDY